MAKMILKDLLESNNSFAFLVSQRDKLSGKINYQISKNIKPIDNELKAYEDARKAIVNRYANKDENGEAVIIGDAYDIPESALSEYMKELDELKETEVEFEIKKMKVDDLENAGLSALDYYNLDFMLEE